MIARAALLLAATLLALAGAVVLVLIPWGRLILAALLLLGVTTLYLWPSPRSPRTTRHPEALP